ncbi:hypothetical protein BJ993_004612 [Nocardioides aromaticivorans]|uniref:Uncharacterized protein n=1 Tax=Nocardioides aromaticivorans TaxID=200618 RepID=A0A7Y9ZL87_9ACTN|nr:hypothetical protein [Nocardioides aromaticivorans]NYI47532.1 hypothetical protein [Nocardioides aromaticivorans]
MTEPAAGVTTADVAGRWFAIEVEYEPIRRGRKAGWIAAGGALYFVTLGVYILPLRQRSTVRLLRRSDMGTVATYEHRHAADLDGDLVWFRTHLVEDQVFDFCRRIGVATAHVEGGGQDFEDEDLVRLVELR